MTINEMIKMLVSYRDLDGLGDAEVEFATQDCNDLVVLSVYTNDENTRFCIDLGPRAGNPEG